MFDVTWEEKLDFLVNKDHQMREVLRIKGILSDSYHPELEKLQKNNALKLADMIKKMGFPVLSNAGEKGVRLSWLVVQHAISLPEFMRESLTQMRLAGAQNDYILELLAYTEDRIAYFEGRAQIYGTNIEWIHGELKRTPIEDITYLDARRKSLGLLPIAQVPIITSLERPPKDHVQKEKEFQAWLLKTGWRN